MNSFEAGQQLAEIATLFNSAERRRREWKNSSEKVLFVLENAVADVNAAAEQRDIRVNDRHFGFSKPKQIPTLWDGYAAFSVGLATEVPLLHNSTESVGADGEKNKTVTTITVTEPSVVFSPALNGKVRAHAYMSEVRLHDKLLSPAPPAVVIAEHEPRDMMREDIVIEILTSFLSLVINSHWTTRR